MGNRSLRTSGMSRENDLTELLERWLGKGRKKEKG